MSESNLASLFYSGSFSQEYKSVIWWWCATWNRCCSCYLPTSRFF